VDCDKKALGFLKKIAKSKVLKFVERAAAYWAPSDIITLIVESFEEDPPDQFIGVNQKLDDIASKIDDLSKQIETSTTTILYEVNIVKIKEIGALIDAAPSKLSTIISESASDRSALSSKLTEFVRSYSSPANMEYLMVQYLNSGGRFSASPMNRFADVVKNYGQENFCSLKSSPNAMIFEFHLYVMNSVLKLTSLLAAAQRMNEQISGRSKTKSPMAAREQQAVSLLYQSMRDSASLVSDSQSLSSYINLDAHGGYNPLRFEIVFQRRSENRHWVLPRGSNLLSYVNCADHTKTVSQSSGNTCRGYLRDCKDENMVNCVCTCDQINHPGTMRKIYAGLIEAQGENSVITAVRFNIQKGVLFLQIQTGKLLPLGVIESTQWQSPPSDLERNYFTFDYDDRHFALEDLSMDNHILTGVKLQMFESNIRLTVVGKQLVNKDTGALESHTSKSLSPTPSNWKEGIFIPIAPDLDGRKYGINQNDRKFTIERTTKGEPVSTVNFVASEDEGGQATVPYFDGSSVELDMPIPLSGIGFIHYRNSGHSGFIRPILKTFNYKHLIPNA